MACRYHAQGRCRYGKACNFSHDIQDGALVRTQHNNSAESRATASRPSNREPRHRREDQQISSQVQTTASQRLTLEKPSNASVGPSRGSKSGGVCHTSKVKTRTKGDTCQTPYEDVYDDDLEQKEIEARLATEARAAKEAAAKTVRGVVFGSIVTLGAGFELSHLVAGFDCCTLRIANLPPNVQESEIDALFTERGLDRGRFHLVNVKPMANGARLSAEIITDAESGGALSLGSDCLEFRDEILNLEVSGYNGPGGMSLATKWDANILTISWRAPSVRYAVVYPDTVPISKKVQELNRRICSGRRVKVEVNTMPPGRFMLNFQANSIRISSLPPCITDEEVTMFSGSASVRRLMGGVSEDIGITVTTLRDNIEYISPGTLISLEPMQPIPNINGIVLVHARFATWDDAHVVHRGLLNHHSGHISFWYWLPSPTQYSVTISAEQFQAQKALFTSLINGIKDKSSCMLHIHEQGAIVRMRLSGSTKEAIGALKVRLERLIAGEKVDGWHRSFGSSGDAFVRSVFDDTGALLRADLDRQVLKAYGKPKAIERARELVKAELDRLSSAQYTRTLARESVTISDDEEARHALERLIQGSLSGSQIPELSGEQTCPICLSNISFPFRLECGHVYCAACMRHFLTSAMDSDRFPLTCIGNKSQCRVPIPIPTIRQFLPLASFNRLLEAAFKTHISRNPEKYKYCKTPDCSQIYRAADANTATVGQCPSCFTKICTSCHDAHDGMSCDDYNRHAEEERQTEAWLTVQDGPVKKCPLCRALIEKTEGCNHVTCTLCDSHFCWRCMRIFTAKTIYKHMNDEHGI